MSKQNQTAVYSLVLAGGQAVRMNNLEKGLVEFKGKPMVAYAINALLNISDTLAISCNRQQSDYQALLSQLSSKGMATATAVQNKPIEHSAPKGLAHDSIPEPKSNKYWLVGDQQLAFAGPMSGIISFLLKLEKNQKIAGGVDNDGFCVVTSCDMPLLSQSAIEYLIERAKRRSATALHFTGGSLSKIQDGKIVKDAYLPMVFNAKKGIELAKLWSKTEVPKPRPHYSLRNWLNALSPGQKSIAIESPTKTAELTSINTLNELAELERNQR